MIILYFYVLNRLYVFEEVREWSEAIWSEDKSSQVTFIYIALLTIQIVSKQLHNIKIGK